jgi:hypothetical protein
MPRHKTGKSKKQQTRAEPNTAATGAMLPEEQAYVEKPETDHPKEHGEEKPKMPTILAQNQSNFVLWMQTWLPIIISALVLIAIAVQAYIYKKQWEAMRDALDEARMSRESGNRPWVNAESVELMKPIELPPSSRFSIFLNVTVKNTGTSVASDGIAFFHAMPNSTEILSREWNKPCETVDTQRDAIKASSQYNPWMVGFVLVPGQSTKLPIGASSDNISPDQARAGDFYVLGCMTYKDQFNTMHRTRFCFRPTSAIDDPANVTFGVCNAFQEAT